MNRKSIPANVLVIHTLLLLAKAALILTWDLELHYEEAQYWLWSKYPDWSYYSKPGMVAWMNWLSTGLWGDTPLGVKFPALVSGWLMGLTTYLLAYELFREYRVSLLASLVLYLMPFYYSVSLFHSTDTFLCAFLLLALLFLYRAAENGRRRNWVLAGAMLGLAMLSKYAAIIFVPASVLYLLLMEKKKAGAWKGWSIAMGTAVVFCLPIVIWNAANDWVTFKHVFTLGGGGATEKVYTLKEQLQAAGEYIGGQAAIISPFLLLILPFARKNGLSRKKRIFLLVLPLVSFFLFLALSLYKQKAANVNWPMSGYVTLPIFFAAALHRFDWRKWFLPLAVFQLALLLMLGYFKNFDLLPFKLKKDPRMDYVGWRQLAREAEKTAQEIDGEKTIFLSANYQVASAVTFYMQEESRREVFSISGGGRMNQLLLWNRAAEFENDPRLTIIYMDKRPMGNAILARFDAIIDSRRVEVKVRDLPPKTFYLYTAKGSRDFSTKVEGY